MLKSHELYMNRAFSLLTAWVFHLTNAAFAFSPIRPSHARGAARRGRWPRSGWWRPGSQSHRSVRRTWVSGFTGFLVVKPPVGFLRKRVGLRTVGVKTFRSNRCLFEGSL